MSRGITRKDLFRSLFGALRDAGERAVPRPILRAERFLRPPGARLPDTDYLAACTGCEACVPVCPPHAIFMVEVAEAGGKRVAVLQPERSPCLMCEGTPCIAACEPGALQPVDRPAAIRIGVAQVDPNLCRPFRGERCDICYRACPLPDRAIRTVNGRPIVLLEGCTGCGMCVRACPESPTAIQVVPERDLIPGVRLPTTGPGSVRRA